MSAPATKAVILAAGRGTRMSRPDPAAHLTPEQAAAADRGWKALMPIHGRPFLDYGISALADAGVSDVCIVDGPGGPVRELYRRRAGRRVRFSFATQAEPRGSADALRVAEEFADGDDFLACNADNLYPASALQALAELAEPGLPVFERERLLATSNFSRPRVNAFAVLDVDREGYLRAIVEKSGDAGRADGRVLLSMNLWRFSSSIFEACREVPLSSRGESELPQAVGWAIARGAERFRAVACGEGVLDLSTRSDVSAVEEWLAGAEASL